jgi:hypothetical protein
VSARLAPWAPWAGLAALVLLRGASAPPWPDDWDGIGFVESIGRFDLDRFAPHPPGYPVYVAMLRAEARVARDPIAAANVVAVACGVAAIAMAAWAAARLLGRTRAAWLAAFVASAPLVWRTSTAIGSEAPALAFACAAIAGAAMAPPARAASWIGVAVGLGMGARLSWAPLFVALLALAPRGERRRAIGAAAGATLAWAIPLAAVVGPRHLLDLARTHASGHFRVWGGSAITLPSPAARAWFLARDVASDGLGAGRDALGVAIAIAVLALAAFGLVAWRARGWVHARYAWCLAPYVAWIALGQNLRDQPRHALPVVFALAALLGLAASTSRAARVAGAIALSLIAARTTLDARARSAVPPPGAQLVELASSGFGGGADVMVFGGPSTRFFELARGRETAPRAEAVGTLGEAHLALGRVSALPQRVLVTSEITGPPALTERRVAAGELVPRATLCRPPRIERRAPCLAVFAWRVPGLGDALDDPTPVE